MAMVRWVPIKLRARKSGFCARDLSGFARLAAMCGIVGYAGARPALSIVLDGLRRLEYRGYDSAGVAVISDGELLTRSGPASWPTWSRRCAAQAATRDRHRPRHHRHRAHPVGHPRRPDRPQRPPAPLDRRPGRGHPQRHHRELRQAAGRAGGRRRRVRQRHRHRVRRAPARGRADRGAAERLDRRPAAGRGDAPGVPPAGGRVHPARGRRRRARTWSSAPGATRRWWSAAATARTSWPATCPRSSSTPARRSSWARTRSC